MTSEIYARYTPSSRKKTSAINTDSSTISNATRTANPTVPLTTKDASSTYSRYIPPGKQKTKPVVDSRIESPDTQAVSSKRKRDDIPEEIASSKKSKKQGKERIKRDLTDEGKVQGRTKAESPAEIKVKRKSKIRDDGAEEDAEDGEDKRHKRLLGKREKSVRKAQKAAAKAEEDAPPEELEEELAELHDLVPLPQPEPIPEPPPPSSLAALPPWLANPIRVHPTSTSLFSEVGVAEEVEIALQKSGFKSAFAVQAALLPFLLPGDSQEDGDFLISAATGSGKTLSYILPMIEDISHNQVIKLRGLIVLPTRELVSQAKEVSEMCASMFTTTRRLRIGTAVGNETFKTEQNSLIEQDLVYDPAGYREQLVRLNRKWEQSEIGDDEDLYDEEAVPDLPDHVYNPISKVDILICTPGRLVEHLKSTNGFTLRDVQWLVVDEADKLLDQSFQDWLDVVAATLKNPRKVILSATMTRDVGKLSGLKLYRPRLIVVEEENEVETQHLFLPATLRESAIKVEDEGAKPLYLMSILQREGLLAGTKEIDSDSSESDSSDGSSGSSDESSDSSDESSGSSDDSSNEEEVKVVPKEAPHGALIFTKSNESAVRLGRLIALLSPASSDRIGILTSTTRSSERKSAIKAFEAGRLTILFASDLVSRGLDLTNLAHVINYDIPTSLTSYVHRVGRTARAGKQGQAWTLFTSGEGRWFWNEIGKTEDVKRPAKMARIKFDSDKFERAGYDDALDALGQESNET